MRPSESGFTLVELLVATAILTIISGVVAQAMFVALRTTDSTGKRLDESSDAQLVSSWFFSDIQSAKTVATSADNSCGTGAVLRLTWDDDGDANVVTYSYQADPERVDDETAPRQLVRMHCTEDGLGTHIVDQQTLARSLSATTGPVVACQPAGATTTTTLVGATPCSPLPVTVAISLTEASGYQYRVNASTRSTP